MVVGHPVHVTGCGRTDAGVHARVYIANFRTTSRIPVGRLPYALNTHLPLDIVVTDAREVPEGFNAIGSCVKKEYTYLIYNSAIKDPFYVNRAWFYPEASDEKVMQLAGSQFVGTHDFAAVRSVGTEVKSTVRTVYYYEVAREGDIISLRVCANGFLYNMARAMPGTVVYAAEGKFPPESVAEILERGDRKAAGPTVPPGGLYMTQLWYDDGEVRSMSDNVTNLNEKQKKWPVRRIILFAVLVLVVCLGVAAYVFRDSLNLDAARRFVRYLNVSGGGTDGQFLFDAGNANQYADFDGGLAVAGATGISTYEADGSEFTVVQEKLTTPAIAHAGKQVMAYDVGGYALHVIRAGKGSVLDVTAERPFWTRILPRTGVSAIRRARAAIRACFTSTTEIRP